MGRKTLCTWVLLLMGAATFGDTGNMPAVHTDVSIPGPILTWESAVLNITVTNTADTPLYLPSLIPHSNVHDDRIEVQVKCPDEEEYRSFARRLYISSLYTHLVSLEMGKPYRLRSVLLTGHELGCPFEKPGVYQVKVKVQVMTDDPDGGQPVRTYVEATPASVTVIEAKDKDQEAMALWGIGMGSALGIEEAGCTRDGMAELFGANNVRKPAEPYAALDMLRAEYSDTIYGRFAQFFRTDPWNLSPNGNTVKLEREERAAVYRELVENAPAFPLRDEALLRLAQSQPAVTEEDKSTALALLDELMREYPDSPVIREAEEMAAACASSRDAWHAAGACPRLGLRELAPAFLRGTLVPSLSCGLMNGGKPPQSI